MRKTKVIAINSVSGGGKTTVTKELYKKVPKSAAIYFDDGNYDVKSEIMDIEEWVSRGSNANEFDLSELEKKINFELEKGYDYLFLDYPFDYRHDLIKKYIDTAIYIDTPSDLSIERKIQRDNPNEEISLSTLLDTILKNNFLYEEARRLGIDGADLIVDGNQTVDAIVKTIIENEINLLV
ncbi:hypothetical protein [Anaerorhabdus furcosa]|uniref:Uridine kinase n=1 Tax=Anaerorhabdus furcosa TaxID=118967 RepID=A0A1T4N3A6_9FIRM|nr:hypothetical protein [Anaerorhabdus furcosa]SJZ73596.1 Uridine kinase [Anaerorhabdus furcosa]